MEEGERGWELFRKMAGMEANKRKRKVCKKNEFGKGVDSPEKLRLRNYC